MKIEEIYSNYRKRKKEIKARIKQFSKVPQPEYFYELVFCILTPQSSAEHAEKVVRKLKEIDFKCRNVNPEPYLRNKESYIRFHKVKSRYLISLKKQFSIVSQKVSTCNDAFELREWLVKNVYGLGYKETTHFLRNIGKNNGLAILDRHILHTLKALGVIKNIPINLNKKKYIEIEERFKKFSSKIGIDLDELDLLFWSMRTGKIIK